MKIELNPQAYFDLVIQPSYSDITAASTFYPDTLHLFEIADNVSLANGMTMVDIFKKQNFLKRKDASCKTVWSKVGSTGLRKLTVKELYSAVEFCQEEFYTGSLKDLRDNPELFRNIVFDLLDQGTRMDMLTNNYFGDITRSDDAAKVWNWNSYDGIVVKIAEYNTLGVISNNQMMDALPDGDVTPQQAHDILEEAYQKRTVLMKTLPDIALEFTIDQQLAEAYEDYLIATGINTTAGVDLLKNGVPTLKYKRIPIYIENTWNPILAALNGGQTGHMCILTIGGQFVFGTNKSYGGGANLDQAVRVWYSEDEDIWKKKNYIVAGTQLKSPQHVVFGITNIA